MDDKQLLEAWEIHNRINLYLLEAVEPAHLTSQSASKGRNVGEQFAHIHNVRLMWTKVSAPDLMKGLNKIEKDRAADKKLLRKSLVDSGKVIQTLLDPDYAGAQTVRTSGRQEGSVRYLGVGCSLRSRLRPRGTEWLCRKNRPDTGGYRILRSKSGLIHTWLLAR